MNLWFVKLAVRLLNVFLLLTRSSIAASTGVCPTFNARAQFKSAIDGRCSPCTVGVCRTYSPIPRECICQCVEDYPSGSYSLQEKQMCGAVIERTVSPGTTPGPAQGISEHTWTLVIGCFVVIAFIWLSAITCYIFTKAHQKPVIYSTKEKEPLIAPVKNINNNLTSMPSMEEIKLEDKVDTSLPLTTPAEPCATRPRQETRGPSVDTGFDAGETLRKQIQVVESSIQDNDSVARAPVEEQGPIKPCERIPASMW